MIFWCDHNVKVRTFCCPHCYIMHIKFLMILSPSKPTTKNVHPRHCVSDRRSSSYHLVPPGLVPRRYEVIQKKSSNREIISRSDDFHISSRGRGWDPWRATVYIRLFANPPSGDSQGKRFGCLRATKVALRLSLTNWKFGKLTCQFLKQVSKGQRPLA